VAQRIVTEIAPAGRQGGEALAARLTASGVRRIDYAAWLRIDAVERARAEPGRARRKFAGRDDLLASIA
jgi:hypothetical protein